MSDPKAQEVPAPPADDVRDELPADLDATVFRVPYEFPNNSRRRIPAVIYLVLGAAAIAVDASVDSPLVNRGVAIAGIGLLVFGCYGIVAGRRLVVDETEALAAAVRTVGFPIGHASAQLTWRSVLSRPAWRLLAYSAENPPRRRAMVVVDGIDGSVLEWFTEANPEVDEPASGRPSSDDPDTDLARSAEPSVESSTATPPGTDVDGDP